MVIPRSRSMSMRSRYCARICRASTTPVSCNMRSASVDLPWSMWAMMQKLRINAGGVLPGPGAFTRAIVASRLAATVANRGGGRAILTHRVLLRTR